MLQNLVEGGPLAAGLLLVVVLLAAALVLTLRLAAQRRWTADIREISTAVEELRAGKGAPGRLELARQSPLAPLADSLNRALQEIAARQAEAAATQERLRLVMEAFKDSAVIGTDMDGDIRSFSAGASALLGYTEDEARAQPSSMLFDDAAYSELLSQLGSRTERERGIVTRSMLRRKDGSTLPVELTARTVHGPRHEPNGLLMVVQDLSRHAGLEEELRRSEERYRRLVEGLADGVAMVRGGRLLYVNPAFSALCGLPAERLVGTPLRDRIATRDVLTIEEGLGRIEREAGAAEEMRCTFVGADERGRADVRFHAASVGHEGGSAVLLLVHDETATRRIERELRRNESQLDAVLEAASEGILVLAERAGGSMVQMTNRALLELFGLREVEVLGQSEERLGLLLRERGEGAARVAALLAAGTATSEPEPVRLGGAAQREIEVSLVELREREGRRAGRMLVCRDLTREREIQRRLQDHAEQLELRKVMLERAYRELDRANRDLLARSEELDRANRELRRLDEMRQKLLGNVSHELQAPLVAIRGFTEMILKERLGPITEEQRKGLTLSLSNTDRLIGLIDSISAPPGTGELSLSEFPLRTLIEETVGLLRGRMEAKGIHFTLAMPDNGLAIQADRDKIQQVFINVLGNAIKFNKQGGSIEVVVRRSGERFVDVDVTDTGAGIPPESLERIFDRHYRAAGTAEGPEGRGLGLSIVREILDRHGCRIRAKSESGKWTRISFSLPQAGRAARQGSALEPEGPSDGPAESPKRPRFRVIRRYRRR